MKKPQTLLEDISPNGNIQAIVEQDDRVAYLYLHPGQDTELPLKSCWVRNLVPAPEELERATMKRGKAPLLPRHCCSHPEGAAPLQQETLRVIWFEEGDAAALLDGSELLAVIPGWSGNPPELHGYARDCCDKAELCWPLGSPESNPLFARVAAAERFWVSWKDPGRQWEQLQDSLMQTLEAALGPHSNYYVIDGGYWPPKAMIKVPTTAHTCLVTLGVSIRPQPTVEMAVEVPQEHRRIELGLCLAAPSDEQQLMQLAGYLNAQTNLPWTQYTWLGQGHTVPCDSLPPNAQGPPFVAVLLLAEPDGAPAVKLPAYRGDRVNLLWMVPITSNELAYAIDNGSQALAVKLRDAGVGWIVRPRPEVALEL